MSSPKRMNLAYIEENLDDEIEYTEVKRLALCSEYHFCRMFSFLAGMALSDYIRGLCMTLAAFDLFHARRPASRPSPTPRRSAECENRSAPHRLMNGERHPR